VSTPDSKYVYGIVSAGSKPPSARGLHGARLQTVGGERTAAIVSDVTAEPLRAGREDLMTHADVLEQTMKRDVVLPMRFGMVMPNADAVREQLLERFDEELAVQLDVLRGKVEMRLRATYDENAIMAEIVASDPGIGARSEAIRERPPDATYYERIELGQSVAAAIGRAREQDAAAILDELEPLAVAVDIGEPAHEHMAAQISFLIEERKLADFDRAVDRLARRNAGRLHFKSTGPLPAYSFVHLPTEV
jgi:hypothetical protein